MAQLLNQVHKVQARQQRQWMWSCLSWGMIAGGATSCIMGLLRIALQGSISWTWVMAPIALGAMVGVIYSLITRRSEKQASFAIDRACSLKDRIQTALQFIQAADTDPLRRLQIEDAEQYAASIVPEKVVPISQPRLWPLALSLTALALVLVFLSNPSAELQASQPINAVVEKQADRIENELEELKQLQEEEKNPELEQVVKELQKLLEQMKQPGLDPKEALAKLSEMEASLQQMQQQLADPQATAELQEIGEALSLSEAMATAGEALTKGEMQKAAEQLEKIDMPELDRQTEKAVTEKLEKLSQKSQDGEPKTKSQKAANQISQGLSQGNRSKFSDGMKSLAGECRKQGNKKKLVDLLKKQCQCLGECKGECEGECRNQAEGAKKGGSKAGTASSGNQPGDKTAKLKTNPEMKIKGQENGSGDSEVETETGDQQQQEAVRAYREKAGEYEALSESVLESESIPLGHRQTIRKYFQMIRPTEAENDSVNKSTDNSK
jgi:hypothetical protein